MRGYFFLFALLWSLSAMAWSLQVSKPVYAPGDEIKATLSWTSEDASNSTSITAQLTLPGGVKLYITPNGLTTSAVSYGTLSRSGSFKLLDFTYPLDSWLPPGVYHISVFAEGSQLPVLSSQFEVTSHYIPLTYQGKDPGFGPFFVAGVDDGYWIVMACKPYERGKGYPLWSLKISQDGHTLVPPFFTGIYKYSANLSSKQGLNLFAVRPTSTGGFYILSNTKNPERGYDLTLCQFDSHGRRLDKKVLKTDRNHSFISLWFEVLPDKILVTAGNGNTLYLYVFSGEGKSIPVYSDFQGTRYRAHFDRDSERLFILIENYYDREIMWKALDLKGNVLFERNIPVSDYGYMDVGNVGFPDNFLEVQDGFLDLHPQLQNSTLILFKKDGSYTVKTLPGYYYSSGGWWLAKGEGDVIHALFSQSGGDFGYMRFTSQGEVIIPPTTLVKSDTYSSRPFVASKDGKTIFIAPKDGSLKALFLNYDRRREPDIVLSKALQRQDPSPYAKLDETTNITLRVFNRGEEGSGSFSVTLSYLGNNYTAQVDPLAPGDFKDINFSLQEPPFLTEEPLIQVSVDSNDYAPNNNYTSYVVFPPSTPIYPEGSRIYTWQIVDAGSGSPIPKVRVSYTLSQISLVSGGKGNVTIDAKSDEDGRLETVLPDGSYRFLLHKYGYPNQYAHITVPGADQTLRMEPPGDIQFSFLDARSGGDLHPGPQRVSVYLKHLPDESLPDWREYEYEARGLQSGFSLKNLMPGDYSLEISAFGYEKKSETVSVYGGRTSQVSVSLTPIPRGNATGRVVSEGHGVKGAYVEILGSPLSTTTDDSGTFELGDVPVGSTYYLSISKDGYASRIYSFSMDSEETALGDYLLPKIYSRTYNIDKCRYAAWVQDAEWSVGESYKVKTIFGVWDLSGALHYKQIEGSSQIDINQLDLEINGLRWTYWGLETDAIQAFASWYIGELGEFYKYAKYLSQVWDVWDWGETPGDFLVTYNSLSDPMGTVRGGVVDCGKLEALDGLNPPSSEDPSDVTILRIDDVRIYEGDELLYSLHDTYGWRQYFSDEYENKTMEIPIVLPHPVDKDKLHVAIYFFVENGNYDSGPLGGLGIDKYKLGWRLKNDKLTLEVFKPRPEDYPTFEY